MTDHQPRLSINSVTAQNFALPGRIASFVNDVFASYSMVRTWGVVHSFGISSKEDWVSGWSSG